MADTKPPPKAGDAGVLMGLLSTSFVAWLLIGALAHCDDSFMPVETAWILTASLSFILAVCLILSTAECPTSTHSQGAAYYTAAIMGFGVSTIYALTSNGWYHNQRRVFWSLSGLFGGIFLEASTGFFSSCARRLQASMINSESVTGLSGAAKNTEAEKCVEAT
ncbi:uncharacterized protein CTRU02_210166 [Colletotrichum truncatum]|uniref:Uncharacterized protein n=1 Tax=Colletotrichum truncatum TaxID=5467 RepID=A0ACC3YUI1_COLTU|nr:uncharacterized protein CTRU02_15596 [Colletotrichum truncatum]KAF6780890.1 hypothetical protein CTRU02_15596 [Colletotrichum truncatum]